MIGPNYQTLSGNLHKKERFSSFPERAAEPKRPRGDAKLRDFRSRISGIVECTVIDGDPG